MAAARSRWFVLLWALLPFLAALGGAAFPPDQWFVALAKPSWQPPNYLFGPVKSIESKSLSGWALLTSGTKNRSFVDPFGQYLGYPCSQC